jgi:hypothetical protein
MTTQTINIVNDTSADAKLENEPTDVLDIKLVWLLPAYLAIADLALSSDSDSLNLSDIARYSYYAFHLHID